MPHDIVDLLGEDHTRLARLNARMRPCAQPGVVPAPFDEFAVQLGGHLTMVRRVVYPALKALGWRNVSSSLLVAHAKVAQAFAEQLTRKKHDGGFAEALSGLLEAMQQMVEIERAQLLPLLAGLPDGTRLALAVDAEHYLPRLPSPLVAGPAGEAALERPSPRDWIEQARLLLGGMRPTAPRSGDEGGAQAPSP